MASVSFWRRTPPALFPATLGAIGLALGWRGASETLGAPSLIADILLLMAGVVFAVIFVSYIAKLIARPSAVLQDMTPAPARAAVSAGSMCLMVLAANLVAVGITGLAEGLWLIGLTLHVIYMLCMIWVLKGLPKPERAVTPVLFLPFVGYIVSPFAGPALGYETLSFWVFMYTLAAGAVILVLAVPPFFLKETPAPARPAAAITLAPMSVAAISSDALGMTMFAVVFGLINIPVALLMLAKARWLTAAGFSPTWGAFTFPAASFAGLMVMFARYWGGVWDAVAWATLTAAAGIVLPIWLRTLWMWSQGALAPATGAGIAR
ncbi:MAG: hypothetical protein AAF401_01650 [Pseudomonadota bacterium]